MKTLFLSALFLFPIASALAGALPVVIPPVILQGDPALVTFHGVPRADIVHVVWNGKYIPVFTYRGASSALIGVDLRAKTGTSTLVATLKNGNRIAADFFITPRKKVTAPLGIPQKLGGNTPEAASTLVATLATENMRLAAIKTSPAALWTKRFIFPVKDPVVTDAYGYLRKTGYYDIAHKGTDFRADIGTPVFAINDGVVRLATTFTVYGKTVVVDHGGAVVSFYMHLSQVNVKTGQKVAQDQLLGLSGETGYALEPHLHLSIRIGGVSIDPIKFFPLFQ